MDEFLAILPLAILLDTLFGDPESSVHPIRLLGHVINGGRRTLRSIGIDGYVGGLLLVVLSSTFVVGIYVLVHLFLFPHLSPRVIIVVHGLLLYLCIAFRSMFDHALNVVTALRDDELDDARDAVQPMVGRDAEHLDAHGVGRATVESLAESYVDALVGPLFWFCAGALVGLWSPFPIPATAMVFVLEYRVVNTLDAMVGYRSEPYRTFGWFSARLDDLLNLLPARMAVPLLFVSSLMTDADTDMGLRTWLRDRHNHFSPNAGQTESFVAGALHVQLGGPSVYPQGVVEKPWMGEGTPEVTEVHIKKCVRMIMLGGIVAYLCAFALLVGVHRVHLAMTSPY